MSHDLTPKANPENLRSGPAINTGRGIVGAASPVASLRSQIERTVSATDRAVQNPILLALVTPLIQALIDQLMGGCLASSRDRAIRYIREPDNFWTQRAYRAALRDAEKELGATLPGGDRTLLREITSSEIACCTDEELHALFAETERHADYGLI